MKVDIARTNEVLTVDGGRVDCHRYSRSMTITVQCQHRHRGNQCSKRTSNPVGLCHVHINSGVTLSDVNNGTGKMPVMTAIPQIGGARAESFNTKVDLNDNRAVVNQMAADQKQREKQDEQPSKPSLGQRLRGMFS